MAASRIRVGEEVRGALEAGRGVVALETSVVAQGLPPPANLEAARRCADAVRSAGSVPAPVLLLDGVLVIGASDAEIAAIADPAMRAAKAAARDLAPLLAARRAAGTTVSATAYAAARAGVRVFATGGIGGVHRILAGDPPAGATDVSADLAELARCPICVVCAGPKAVLDLQATSEALETLGVPALGYGTGELPAFYTDRSGIPLEHHVDTADEAAAVLRLHWETLGRREGVLLLVPPPAPLAREVVEAAVARALEEARRRGVRGKAVTPFLLESVARETGGRSREANLALLERNAGVAGAVAAALARAR